MEVLSRLNKGLHKTRMKLVIVPPIYPPNKDSYTKADYREVTRAWHEAVNKIEV
jgi:hypothetical protein